MNNQESLRIIAGWLTNLAELTRHGEEGKPTKNKIAVTATMLGKDFPSGAFTTDSLHFVVQGCEWHPAYDVIRQRLGEWWRDHRPASVPLLVGPKDADLSPTDRSWLAYWYARRPDIEAKQRRLTERGQLPGDQTQRPLSHFASLVRSNSPKAWWVISGMPPAEAPQNEPHQAQKSAIADALRSLKEAA
jgi:hypothetical protein